MKKIATAHIILLSSIIMQIILVFVVAIGNLRLPVPLALSVSQLTMLLPFIVYCIWKKENPLKLIRFKKVRFSTVLFSIAIGFASYPVVVFLNMVSMMFVENAMSDVMTEVLSMGLGAGLIYMAFLPAIVEETIFRGVVYNTYSKRRPIIGIFLSALLFGLMHMNFNQMPYAFYLGIVMALLMEACDSIIAPMILHFTMNATSTILSFSSMGVSEPISTEATDIKSLLIESYQLSAAEMGMELTEAQLTAMLPTILAAMIGVFAVMALIALGVVCILVYAVFRSNNRKPSEVFKVDHSDTAYLLGKDEKMHKNRMIDLWVVIFIIYTFINCILSIG